MLAYSVTSSGLFPRMLWALLLLAASLNAYNDVWDKPCCTAREVSVNRGSRVVMACNISNNLRDVTIELITSEKTSIIFNQTPPGNYSKDSWQLHIQGGQAQLVITDAQGKHSGEYWWKLRGFQAEFKNFTLTVNDEEAQSLMDDWNLRGSPLKNGFPFLEVPEQGQHHGLGVPVTLQASMDLSPPTGDSKE